MTHTSKLVVIAHQPRFGARIGRGRQLVEGRATAGPRAAMVARTDDMFTPS
jgi:hypothetical protein